MRSESAIARTAPTLKPQNSNHPCHYERRYAVMCVGGDGCFAANGQNFGHKAKKTFFLTVNNYQKECLSKTKKSR